MAWLFKARLEKMAWHVLHLLSYLAAWFDKIFERVKINYNCSTATIIWLANCIPVQKQARKNFFPGLLSDMAAFTLRVMRFFFKKSNLKYHSFNNLSCLKFNAKWDINSVGAVTREHGSSFLLDSRQENLSPENYSKHLFDIVWGDFNLGTPMFKFL